MKEEVMKEDKDKEKEELTEEEIYKLIEELKKQKSNKKIAISLGFLNHPNYIVHLMISFIMNILLSAVVFGLGSGLNQKIVIMNPLGFFIAITLLTVVENFVKILFFKYFPRVMMMSFGSLNVVLQIVILFIIDKLIEVGFHFTSFEALVMFSIIFSIFRFVLSNYIRKISILRRIK
jgi:uncharacterized membrane protein YvlD (DUF360 family)